LNNIIVIIDDRTSKLFVVLSWISWGC